MPESPSFWDHRGACYAELGRFAEAIADFSKEIELKPDDAVLWRLRARTQETAGRWNEAVADYSKTLELNPADWGVWDDRGMLFLSARQPEKALADFTKSIAIDPKVWWLWQHRSLAYRALDRWQEAIADLSMTVELAPQNAVAPRTIWPGCWPLARTRSSPSKPSAKAAKKTVELEPEKGMWWSTLGQRTTARATGNRPPWHWRNRCNFATGATPTTRFSWPWPTGGWITKKSRQMVRPGRPVDG